MPQPRSRGYGHHGSSENDRRRRRGKNKPSYNNNGKRRQRGQSTSSDDSNSNGYGGRSGGGGGGGGDRERNGGGGGDRDGRSGSKNGLADNGQDGGDNVHSRAKSDRYKTELCRGFQEHGFCKYGTNCQFAHGEEELRVVSRHPKFKTEFCKSFHSNGTCPYGQRCRFIHIEKSRLSYQNAAMADDIFGIKRGSTDPEDESELVHAIRQTRQNQLATLHIGDGSDGDATMMDYLNDVNEEIDQAEEKFIQQLSITNPLVAASHRLPFFKQLTEKEEEQVIEHMYQTQHKEQRLRSKLHQQQKQEIERRLLEQQDEGNAEHLTPRTVADQHFSFRSGAGDSHAIAMRNTHLQLMLSEDMDSSDVDSEEDFALDSRGGGASASSFKGAHYGQHSSHGANGTHRGAGSNGASNGRSAQHSAKAKVSNPTAAANFWGAKAEQLRSTSTDDDSVWASA